MPKQYRIKSPDGRMFEVTAPDGATPEQVMAYAQKHYQSPPSAPASTPAPTQDSGGLVQGIENAGRDLGNAAVLTGRSLLHGALAIPSAVNDYVVAPVVDYAAEKLGSDYRVPSGDQQIDSLLNRAGVPDVRPADSVARVVSDIDRGIGGAVGGLGAAKAFTSAASPVVSGIGRLLSENPGAQLSAAAAGSGASGTARESGIGPKGQIAIGLVGALAPAGVEGAANATTRGLRGLIEAPDAETVQLAQKAARHGIRLTAPQVSPSKTAKLVDSVTSHIPLSGAGKVQAAQQEQFNRAVGRTFGANSPKITPEVFRNAKRKIGGEFNRLTSRNNLQITPELVGKLRGIADDSAAFGDDATHNAVMSAIQRVVKQSKDSALPGRAYQSLDSKLGNIAKSGGEKGHYIGEVREALRDAMDASISPKDQAAWTAARKAYRNLKTVEPLVAKSPNGDISPAALMGRVTSNAPGKISMAQGERGDLGDLARIGQQFLKAKIPDSGTARRLAVLDALKGLGGVATGYGAGVAPLATLGIGGGMVGTARAVQRLLQSQRLLDALTEQSQGNQALQRKLLQSANPVTQTLLQQNQ